MRRLLTLALLLSLVSCAADSSARFRELAKVVDRNTGFAHMTRGVNMYTLIALRSCVAEADIPTLAAMLRGQDRVLQRAAANVLADFGPAGRKALQAALPGASEPSARQIIEEALTGMDSPDHKPLGAYPLTEPERKRIKACGEFAR